MTEAENIWVPDKERIPKEHSTWGAHTHTYPIGLIGPTQPPPTSKGYILIFSHTRHSLARNSPSLHPSQSHLPLSFPRH